MDTIVITPSSQKSIPFLKELLNKLSDVKHVEVVSSDSDKNSKSFSEAAEKCNAVTVDEFIEELKSQVKSHYNHA